MSEVRRILAANERALHNMIHQTKTIRQTYAESTTSEIDTSFDFDHEVVNTAAYRRAFRAFSSSKQVGTARSTRAHDERKAIKEAFLPDARSHTLVSEELDANLAPKTDGNMRSDLTRKLRQNIKEGNTRQVESLLSNDANIETVFGEQSNRPLHIACRNVKVHIVKLLIDKGADISARMSNGNTPLHVAAEVRYTRRIQY